MPPGGLAPVAMLRCVDWPAQPTLRTGDRCFAEITAGKGKRRMALIVPGNATIHHRALILGLALLFSDLDTIFTPADSANMGLGTQPLQSTATHEAPHGHAQEPMTRVFLSPRDIGIAPRNADHTDDDSPLLQRYWAPPPPQGPTLRDHVEHREREAGLRCCAMSCCVGPSDEDPFVDASLIRGVPPPRPAGPHRSGRGWRGSMHQYVPPRMLGVYVWSAGWRGDREAKPTPGTRVTSRCGGALGEWLPPDPLLFGGAALSAGAGPFRWRCLFAGAGLFPLSRGLLSGGIYYILLHFFTAPLDPQQNCQAHRLSAEPHFVEHPHDGWALFLRVCVGQFKNSET
ncbi:hypothetical protein B0H14DRAFT_3758999 [Mycena olivaceomarginata]|nr:hypothetical protein B0H14DRAFT_3758999 [Mycena olivaceomarginata]